MMRMRWTGIHGDFDRDVANFENITNGGVKLRGVEPMLCYVLPWWVPGCYDGLDVHELAEHGMSPAFYDLHHRFIDEVLDPVMHDAEHFLNAKVGEVTWHIWILREYDGCLVLVKGRDYRIVDWERRMRNERQH